jgi:acetyltransferase-like isoleucine patch superfamily enzyme
MYGKALFLLRYLWLKVRWSGTVQTDGLVFIEENVSFRFAASAKVRLGARAYIKKGAILECGPNGALLVGARTVIGYYAWLGATELVEIGPQTLIGNCATIFDVNHRIDHDTPIMYSGYLPGTTRIGEDCLIGTKASVGGNVQLGRGCVVGANSVLNNMAWDDFAIVAGSPARLLRER